MKNEIVIDPSKLKTLVELFGPSASFQENPDGISRAEPRIVNFPDIRCKNYLRPGEISIPGREWINRIFECRDIPLGFYFSQALFLEENLKLVKASEEFNQKPDKSIERVRIFFDGDLIRNSTGIVGTPYRYQDETKDWPSFFRDIEWRRGEYCRSAVVSVEALTSKSSEFAGQNLWPKTNSLA